MRRSECLSAIKTAQRLVPPPAARSQPRWLRETLTFCPRLLSMPPSARNARRLAAAPCLEPVGDLVRALPQGDAGARCAAGEARRPDFEVVAVNIDTWDPTSRRPGSRTSASAASPTMPIQTQRSFRSSKRSARRLACRRRFVDPQAANATLAGPAEWAC